MRWEALFDDLAAQLVAAERADRDVAVADLTRAEHATITFAERLRDTRDVVTLELRDGSRVSGRLHDLGTGWLLLTDATRQHVVLTSAVVTVQGLARTARPAPGPRGDGYGVGHVLRALMRDRRPVQVSTLAGVHPGWIARVGKDHLDLEVAPGQSHGTRTVPFAALVCVSESDGGTGTR
ncbi:hypothetical protein [Cellulosimicrobium arenosum]|uniref:Uncharacterized protein n=1 Tax=Cellulosimicrobium arenosum TaxID=2708133 RepID=A0A927J2H9_9MICO|nr:hypothetical protein [Cellulosimicrobium arenosum]MBD8080711.1 hypothetical protein [Cellulosimicrobium arenosum]